jgi:hypothetical protein
MTYSLDDLSRFSPWPARLLGLESFSASQKNKAEIEREFGKEKWGHLLQLIQSGQVNSLREADLLFNPPKDTLISHNNKFELYTFSDAAIMYKELVSKTCARFFPAPAIVELGAGYGSVILHLAKESSGMKFLAGEITASGRECIERLATTEKINVQTAHCDFNDEHVSSLQIPPGSIIFTSYALHYIQGIPGSFISFLRKIRPRAVILFEPCRDFDDAGVYSLLKKKYMMANNYNLDILSFLKKYESKGFIKIEETIPDAFGINPLLPASIIIFTTCNNG